MPTVTRFIRNSGILLFDAPMKRAKDLQVFVTCSYEDGRSGYFNYRWPVPQGHYGYWISRDANAAIEFGHLEFEFQRVYGIDNSIYQQLSNIAYFLFLSIDANSGGNGQTYVEPVKPPAVPLDSIVFKLMPGVIARVDCFYGEYSSNELKVNVQESESNAETLAPLADEGFYPSNPYAVGDDGFTDPNYDPGEFPIPCEWEVWPTDNTYSYVPLAVYGPGSYQVSGPNSINTNNKTESFNDVQGLLVLGLYPVPGNPNTTAECTILTWSTSCVMTQTDHSPGLANWKLTPSVVKVG